MNHCENIIKMYNIVKNTKFYVVWNGKISVVGGMKYGNMGTYVEDQVHGHSVNSEPNCLE